MFAIATYAGALALIVGLEKLQSKHSKARVNAMYAAWKARQVAAH